MPNQQDPQFSGMTQLPQLFQPGASNTLEIPQQFQPGPSNTLGLPQQFQPMGLPHLFQAFAAGVMHGANMSQRNAPQRATRPQDER